MHFSIPMFVEMAQDNHLTATDKIFKTLSAYYTHYCFDTHLLHHTTYETRAPIWARDTSSNITSSSDISPRHELQYQTETWVSILTRHSSFNINLILVLQYQLKTWTPISMREWSSNIIPKLVIQFHPDTSISYQGNLNAPQIVTKLVRNYTNCWKSCNKENTLSQDELAEYGSLHECE